MERSNIQYIQYTITSLIDVCELHKLVSLAGWSSPSALRCTLGQSRMNINNQTYKDIFVSIVTYRFIRLWQQIITDRVKSDCLLTRLWNEQILASGASWASSNSRGSQLKKFLVHPEKYTDNSKNSTQIYSKFRSLYPNVLKIPKIRLKCTQNSEIFTQMY